MSETGVGIRDPLFFIGVIENNFDPRLEGRVQVRAFGVHGTVQQVPTEDLPWATLIYGNYDANAPIPPINSWVFGFFIDGRDAQQPMVLGLIPTQMTEAIDPDRTGWGNIDPLYHAVLAQGSRSVDYGQPSRSRLARGENIEETYNLALESLRVRNIPSANGAPSWEEPGTAYNAQYPFNRVIETAAGHSIELDDTPGAERIMIYHRSGSYIQVDSRGTTTQRSQSDRYDVTSTNAHVYIGGRNLVTIEGDSHVLVKGNKTEEIMGDYQQIVRGNHMLSVGGQLNLNAGDEVQARGAKVRFEANVEGINLKSTKNINIESSQSIHSKAGIAIFIDSTNSTNIKAGDNIFIDAKGESNIKATKVNIDDVISMANGDANPATGADPSQGAEMPEPAARATSVTQYANLSSIGASGYASTDEGLSDYVAEGGGAFAADGQLDSSFTEGAIRPLLDLIGRAEGAGYDTIYNGSKIRTDKPITTMTIAQLLDWQDRSVAAGSVSSAAGRYQVIRGTLRAVVGASIINSSDAYSPSIQDKIAIYLMQIRGLNRFLSGSLSAEAFGNNLAREWASFPVITGPNAGRSFYDGDSAGNKSRIVPSEVLNVLNALKLAIDSGQNTVNNLNS